MKITQRAKLMIGVTGCALCMAAAAVFGMTRPMYDPILKQKTERIETKLQSLKAEKDKAMDALLTIRKTSEPCAVYNPTTEQKAKCHDVLVLAINRVEVAETQITETEKEYKSMSAAFTESTQPIKTVVGLAIAGFLVFIISAIAYLAPIYWRAIKVLREYSAPNQTSQEGEQ
jgi:hypothetical protein